VGVMGFDERDIIVGDLDKTVRVSFDSNCTSNYRHAFCGLQRVKPQDRSKREWVR
jgi:hypothetical protein